MQDSNKWRSTAHTLISLLCLVTLTACAAKKTTGHQPDLKDRFVIAESGIVFDNKTGLEWYSGDISWLEQSGTHYWLSQLNRKDPGWRLPTQAELYDLNKTGRTYCRSLDLFRDTFWIRHYRVYDLLTNISYSPRLYRPRQSILRKKYKDDNDYTVRAHVIVVRLKKSSSPQ